MLYGWMKSIIIYLIISGLIINMAPAGNYKKYINFFVGLLLLIIVAKPIAYIFNFGDKDVEKLMNSMDYYMNYSKDSFEAGSKGTYYEYSLEEAVERSAMENGCPVLKVAVITDKDYNILKCTIYVKKGKPFDENLIKKNISDVYNVEVDNINVLSR
ncbi:MAG: hypothetical protein E7258_08315 [Lachnospiraceae bacterium]|nr:hypothetical protein [Lachnospiraceae bacterium]